MNTNRPDRLTLLAFACTVLFGGMNAIAVRFSNAELPPFFGAAARFIAAALILFVLVLFLRLPLPRGRSLVGAVVFGLLAFGANYAFLYWSLLQVQAGLAMVILSIAPLLTFIFACLHRQETFRWEALLGALLAVAGIGIIFWDQISLDVSVLPLLAIVLSAACFAEAAVLIKTFPQSHPITTNALALVFGGVFLFALSAFTGETPVVPALPQTWAAFSYLVVFGSVVTFVLSLYVIKRWTASASSYSFVLFPVVTITVSAWLTSEPVSVAFLFGGLLVLAGVYVGGILRPGSLPKFVSGLKTRLHAPSLEK